MGFILLGLVVASVLMIFSWIISRRNQKSTKKLEKVICIISVLIVVLFFSFTNTILDATIIAFGVTFLITFPLSYNDGVKNAAATFVFLNAIVLVVTGCIFGIGNGSGYEENVSEIEVIELAEGNFTYGENEKNFYVYEEDGNYNYLKFNSDTNNFDEINIPKSKARIEINTDCDPILIVYERRAKQTFWSFGLNKKIEYVFYLPTNVVSDDSLP